MIKELLLHPECHCDASNRKKEGWGESKPGRKGREEYAGLGTVAHASDSHAQEAEVEGPLQI